MIADQARSRLQRWAIVADFRLESQTSIYIRGMLRRWAQRVRGRKPLLFTLGL